MHQNFEDSFLPVVQLRPSEIPSYGYDQETVGRVPPSLPRQTFRYSGVTEVVSSEVRNGVHRNALSHDTAAIDFVARRARARPIGYVVKGSGEGRDGRRGIDGSHGAGGRNGSDGVYSGASGSDGGHGSYGRDGTDGMRGGDSGDIRAILSCPDAQGNSIRLGPGSSWVGTISLDANAGEVILLDGKGGDGGHGGHGGIGGDGGSGGDGARGARVIICFLFYFSFPPHPFIFFNILGS